MSDKHKDQRFVPNEELRQWVEACDPNQPIECSDPRYFDLSRVPEDDHTVSLRGSYRLESLLDAMTLRGQSCQLFSGFRGTGKSTELWGLAHQLEETGHIVLLVEAGDYHSLSEELHIVDFLVMTATAFGDATGERLGKDVFTAGYGKRFTDFLQREIEVTEAKLRLGIADVKAGIKYEDPFWYRARQALRRSLKQLQAQTHGFVADCAKRLKKANPGTRGVVFILDSLEKIDPPFGKFEVVMDSVLRVLSRHHRMLKLPDCHSIFTVPPYVELISTELREHYEGFCNLLPAIKVRERGMTVRRYDPGIDAMVALVERRIPVDRVFGQHRQRLARLAEYSGGHVRTMIAMLQDLLFQVRRNGVPVSDEDVHNVIQPYRERAEMKVGGTPGALILDAVLRGGKIAELAAEHQATIARFMNAHLVLCYRNGEGWYDVHPLVRDFVIDLATRAKE